MTAFQTPGLLWNGRWIPPVRSYGGGIPSLTEMLLANGGAIFPGHFVTPFDLILSRHPQAEQVVVDLALVSKDYSAWHLLFVAPRRTTERDRLRENLETAFLSPFGNREAIELKRHIGCVDEDKIHALVTDGLGFVIVTDDPKHGWDDEFKGLHVDIMIVEPFQVDDDFVFRINGKNPALSGSDVFAICLAYPTLPGSLTVRWTALNEPPPIGNIQLTYGNELTNWELLDGGSRLALMPEGNRSPLREPPPFEIIKGLDGTLAIRHMIEEA